MDLLNVLLGIGYLRTVSVRQASTLWYRNAKTDRSGETLAHRMFDDLIERKLLVRSRWLHATWGSRIFRGKVYALSREGARLVRREYGLSDHQRTVGTVLMESLSAHTLMVSHVLWHIAQSLAARHRRIGAAFWREAAISARVRSDALIGIVASQMDVCPTTSSGAWNYAPFIPWETFAYVSQQRQTNGTISDAPALYALEVDCGRDSVAAFGRRAVDYARGRAEAMPFHAAPTPLIITIGNLRARRIVDAWRTADPSSPVYAIDVESFLREPIETAAWVWYSGDVAHEVEQRSPFAWLAPHALRAERRDEPIEPPRCDVAAAVRAKGYGV